MDRFRELLATREEEICGDVFDLLTSMGDFEEFKSIMLSFRGAVIIIRLYLYQDRYAK